MNNENVKFQLLQATSKQPSEHLFYINENVYDNFDSGMRTSECCPRNTIKCFSRSKTGGAGLLSSNNE